MPNQTQTETDDFSTIQSDETDVEMEIDVRIPPKPFYVC